MLCLGALPAVVDEPLNVLGPARLAPDPAPVGKALFASFATSRAVDPVVQQELQIQDLVYVWTIRSVQRSATATGAGEEAPADEYSATLSSGEAAGELKATFRRAGWWTVTVRCVATWKSGGAEYRATGEATVAATIKEWWLTVESDKVAVCAGGVGSPVHQTTITATLTRNGQPVAGEQVTMLVESNDQAYPATLKLPTDPAPPPGSPLHNDACPVTDANGQAKAVLTSSQLAGGTAQVTATYGTEQATLVEPVIMGRPEATWTADLAALVPGTSAETPVGVTLTFDGEPVDGHPVSYRITSVWSADDTTLIYEEDPLYGSAASYGELTQDAATSDAQGAALGQFRVGMEAGGICFTATDGTVFGLDAEVAQASEEPVTRRAMGAGRGPAPVKWCSWRRVNPDVFYVYTDQPTGTRWPQRDVTTKGTWLGPPDQADGQRKFTVTPLAMCKRLVAAAAPNALPSPNQIWFEARRPADATGAYVSALGSLMTQDDPATAFSESPRTVSERGQQYKVWVYRAAVDAFDITKWLGKNEVGVAYSVVRDGQRVRVVPLQVRAIVRVDKRQQIATMARSLENVPRDSPLLMGSQCDAFVCTVYRSLGLSLADVNYDDTNSFNPRNIGSSMAYHYPAQAAARLGCIVLYKPKQGNVPWGHVAVYLGATEVADQDCGTGSDSVDRHAYNDPRVTDGRPAPVAFGDTAQMLGLDREMRQ